VGSFVSVPFFSSSAGVAVAIAGAVGEEEEVAPGSAVEGRVEERTGAELADGVGGLEDSS